MNSIIPDRLTIRRTKQDVKEVRNKRDEGRGERGKARQKEGKGREISREGVISGLTVWTSHAP